MLQHNFLNNKRKIEQKIGIVFLGMGGPSDLDEVRPFLYNLFSDPDIINLPFLLKPFQKMIAWMIAKFRTPQTKQMYQQIGNGSPIISITANHANLVEEELRSKGINAKCYPCMRYTEPRAKTVVDEIRKEDFTDIVLYPQYPHYANATTGSSFNDFYKHYNLNGAITHEISDWGMEEVYLNFWVEGIKNQLLKYTATKNVHLLFSAHALPKRYIDAGEKYPEKVREAVDEIIRRVDASHISTHLSYQSQAGPVEWTRPYTTDKIKEIAKENPDVLIVVPIGFVSNHVETLYEIDILYADEAKEVGIPEFVRIEVPDADQMYSKQVAEMILNKIEGEN
jgi:ferrochelatase